NRLVGPGLCRGLLFHAFHGGMVWLVCSLQGMLTGFFLLIFLWLIGGMGAGDVKLLAAVGAWLGPWNTCLLFMATGFVLGIWVLVYAASRCVGRMIVSPLLASGVDSVPAEMSDGVSGERLERAVKRARRLGSRSEVIPFAAALLGGLLLIVLGVVRLPH
ncbi:MAG: A24 family peptidase, partial [Planctomycetaceae bacterium]